jgi:hypothetical protein
MTNKGFICPSYHRVIHREKAWFGKVIHRFTVVIHRIDLTDIF